MIRVPLLNDTNFPEWEESLLFQLGLMDLDLCFRVSAIPATPTKESNADAKV